MRETINQIKKCVDGVDAACEKFDKLCRVKQLLNGDRVNVISISPEMGSHLSFVIDKPGVKAAFLELIDSLMLFQKADIEEWQMLLREAVIDKPEEL